MAERNRVDDNETGWTEDERLNETEDQPMQWAPAEEAAEQVATEQPGTTVDAGEQPGEQLTGRSIFSIETTGAGVVVRTVFLTEDNRLLNMPMVFPDVMYAMNVIDDLKRQVAQHFSNAARVGGQVIASQAAVARQAEQDSTASASADQEA